MKKRIGLIPNLGDIESFSRNHLAYASAEEIMQITGGNTGNIAFVHGVQSLLDYQCTRMSWGTSADWVKNNIDLIVVACANQLGEHVDLATWAKKLEEFNKPIVLIGIGVQSDNKSVYPKLPEGTIRFLNLVSQLKPNGVVNITTRGNFTSKFLTTLGYDSIPAGCPSLHISKIENLGGKILDFQNKTQVKKISIAAGNPWHGKSSKLERVLTDIVDAYSGAFVLQHPTSMLALALGEKVNLTEGQMSGFLSAYGQKFDKESLTEWYRRNAVFFVDTGNWIQFYKRFDLILGPRYHGVALAVQATRPGTVITIDSRTEELCDQTGIKQISIESAYKLNLNELIESCKWKKEDAENLNIFREMQSAKYKNFLDSIG
ncbi:MAG: hypothetical protein PHF42_08385 [Pseudomonas sp.]|nr:hypothetical protein [Pseudomonas sp.]